MRRRHRPITGFSGLVLFLCAFMPAVEGCHHQPVFPIELPPVLPPYVFGLILGIAALAKTLDTLRGSMFALRAVSVIFAIETCFGVIAWSGIGVLLLLVATSFLVTLQLTGFTERRMAAFAALCGGACSIWFGLWCSGSGTLFGIWVSLVASLGLTVGGLVWLSDTAQPEPELPIATVISSAP